MATPPPAPVALFVGTPRTGAPGMFVTFDSSASTGNPTGFQWDFNGDGIVDSIEPNPIHQYNTAGSWTVTLTVINLTGVDNEVKTGYIDVTTAPGAPTPDAADPRRRRRRADACLRLPAQRHRAVAGQRADSPSANAGFNNVTHLQRPAQRAEEQDPGPEPGSHAVHRADHA